MIDPRQLIGMTQGARKRAAQLDAITAEPDGRFRPSPPRIRRQCLIVFSACLTTPEILRRYTEARAAYRIGERLRPCPYCKGPEWIEEMRCPTLTRTWLIKPPLPPCDGSGVTPARRARR